MNDVDVLRRDPQLFGDDLGERRLVALSLALHGQTYDRLAGGVHPQLTTVGHPQTEDVHVLARPSTDGLGEERDPDAHQLPSSTLLGLLATQVVVPREVEGDLHGLVVLSRVVDPAGLGGIGELLGLDEVLAPQLHRVHAQFVG